MDVMAHPLEVGFELDRRYHLLDASRRGEGVDSSKKPDLILVAEILADVPYALIGGLALQVYQREPRTTLDIDIAVRSYDVLPVAALHNAGFVQEGRFAHSENWRSANGTPVQFSDDPLFREAIDGARTVAVSHVQLKVAAPQELIRAKLRAAKDSERRKSKRMQDLADVQALIEQYPELTNALSDEDKALLG